MKYENLSLMEKDPRLHGVGLGLKAKIALFVASWVPALLVLLTLSTSNDAMVTGLVLAFAYFAMLATHYVFGDRGLWRYLYRKDMAGNNFAKLKYNTVFILTATLVAGFLFCIYAAHIRLGPDELTLPFPYTRTPIDLVYWFWLGVLYLLIVGPLEFIFFYSIMTYSWDQRKGQALVTASLGLMNVFWMIKTVKNDLWRAILSVLYILIGWGIYKIRLRNDLFKSMGVRICFSLSLAIVLVFLATYPHPKSPNLLRLGHPKNCFMP